jgi:PH domain/BAR-like domain
MQQNSAHFEEGIVRSLQSSWQTFDEWQSRMSASVQDTWRGLGQNFSVLTPDREWIAFAARSDHLLDPDTPLRNPEHIDYPSKEDPSVVPVHVGMLERKRRFTRSYRESYFVLTPAGYLHEYTSSDPLAQNTPTFSLFLPACTLGPPSSATTAKSHKFHVEGKKDASGLQKSTSILGKRSQSAYTFRARSHEELMEWWNDLRMLVARYLVAS